MSKYVDIVVVRGAEGRSLQLWGKSGGRRLAGPKAWGNPFNEPEHKFRVDADELIEMARQHAFEPEPPKEV
jgi:hypothetical protein